MDDNDAGSGSGRTRRSVLRSVGGISFFGSIGATHGDSTGSLVPVNVGYRDSSGFESAAGFADSVVRTFGFDAATIMMPKDVSKAGIEALAAEESIRYVEPDLTMAALGQRVPWGIKRIGADTAHDQGRSGSGVDVAILDTGIDSTHPDLRSNLGAGASFIGSSGKSTGQRRKKEIQTGERIHASARSGQQSRRSGTTAPGWEDEIGHGTHCAGIVGAIDNTAGVVGVSSESTLHAVRVLSSSGFGSASDIAAGVDYVIEQGWDVASMSLGSRRSSQLVRDACSRAVEQGTLVVAAVGNGGPCSNCVSYPATLPFVVGVGATTRNDKLFALSSTGPGTDIVAPGKQIRSTYSADGQPYATFSGTSMACPHVAGAGGLLMAQGYSNTDAATRLTETAEDIGLSKTDGGAGLLDVPAALGL